MIVFIENARKGRELLFVKRFENKTLKINKLICSLPNGIFLTKVLFIFEYKMLVIAQNCVIANYE